MGNVLPSTTQRVNNNTSYESNDNIRKKTIHEIELNKYVNPEIFNNLINKLNYEWDTERVLETNAASFVLFSSIMGIKTKNKLWFLLTGVIGFFLLQHALQGWCPPLPVIRKLGIRTTEEINNQKTVYKYLRGDFSQNTKDANEMLSIAEK